MVIVENFKAATDVGDTNTVTLAIRLHDGGIVKGSGLKRHPFELGRLEGYILGCGGEVTLVVAAAVALALLITRIPGSLSRFLCLGLQQLVQRFLYAASYQFLELPLDIRLAV